MIIINITHSVAINKLIINKTTNNINKWNYSAPPFFIFFGFLKYYFSLYFCLLCTVDLHLVRSLTSNSHSSVLIFKLFRSRFHTSLKRNFRRPRLRLPTCHTTETLGFAQHPSSEHDRVSEACADWG